MDNRKPHLPYDKMHGLPPNYLTCAIVWLLTRQPLPQIRSTHYWTSALTTHISSTEETVEKQLCHGIPSFTHCSKLKRCMEFLESL